MVLGRTHYDAGFHQTATSGAFGATIAACRLYGMQSADVSAALGLVSSRASGLKSQFGTMGKPLMLVLQRLMVLKPLDLHVLALPRLTKHFQVHKVFWYHTILTQVARRRLIIGILTLLFLGMSAINCTRAAMAPTP